MNILKTDRLFGLLLEVNAARHNLLLLLEVNAARHNLLLLLKVNAARNKLTTDARKILGILRRVGKGFSERETLLFQTMMVQDQEEIGEGSEMPTDSHHTPTIIQPSTSQPQNKQRSRRSKEGQ
ncbi:hypothetical protein Tco_1136001 [Tanacetum coccineum]